jgi:hypothetical protein
MCHFAHASRRCATDIASHHGNNSRNVLGFGGHRRMSTTSIACPAGTPHRASHRNTDPPSGNPACSSAATVATVNTCP